MKTNAIVLSCVLGIALAGNISAQSGDYSEEIRTTHPDAVEIERGVYAAVEGNRHTVHMFGRSGLEFMIEEIESLLTRPSFAVANPKGHQSLLNLHQTLVSQRDGASDLSKAGNESAIQAVEEDEVCDDVVPYELEAVADYSSFWSAGSYASAAFRRHGVGPAIGGTGSLYAYAEASQNGHYTSDDDSVGAPIDGLGGWISTDTVAADSGYGAGGCITAYSSATFSATCGTGYFRAISESFSDNCD